jgi:anaerobic selenocysteine-containing dehydrogenase
MADFKERLRWGEDPLRVLEAKLREDRNLPAALLLLETGPLYDSYDPEALGERLSEIPLIVSVSSFLSASAELADYVLPAASFLESWVEQPAPPGVPFAFEGLARPVVEPVGDSRPCGDIVLGLARALKIPVSEGDYASLVQDRLAELYQLKRGSVAGTVFDQLWQQLMEQSGWWAPTYETPDQLLGQMESRGGWWDSFYRHEDWARVFRTSSEKFQFHLPEMQASQDSGITEVFRILDSRPTQEAAEDYPFLVNFFDPLTTSSRQPHLPWVREVAGGIAQNRVGVWVEIGEHDASELGIQNGTLVWVESPGGRVQAFARILSTVSQGVVSVPRGVAEGTDPWEEIAGSQGSILMNDSGFAPRVRITRATTGKEI